MKAAKNYCLTLEGLVQFPSSFLRWSWQNDIGRRLPRYGFFRAKYLSKEQSSSDENYAYYSRLPMLGVPAEDPS